MQLNRKLAKAEKQFLDGLVQTASEPRTREAEHARMGWRVSSPFQAKMTAEVQANTAYAEAQERAGTTTLGEAIF